MKLYLNPEPEKIENNNGVGRVVHAQYRYLPEFGIEFVKTPVEADVVASHVLENGLGQLDVLHLHGIYPTAEPRAGIFQDWTSRVNAGIVEAARRARVITMPSDWACEPFRRDMRLTPVVIPNGVDFEDWTPVPAHRGYLLWNKNRNTDVCDPTPALEMARRGAVVISTFAPAGFQGELPGKLRVIGVQPHEAMKELIRHAEVFLATTIEVMSLSVLEAMAAGVPVLAYDWGGNSEVVRHGVDGYLAKPNDLDDLMAGLAFIQTNREELAENARARAREYDWLNIIPQYVEVYERAYALKKAEKHTVGVVITNYNYAQFVGDAIDSALSQTRKPDQITIIDDGSTDNSDEIIQARIAKAKKAKSKVRFLYIKKENAGVAHARNRGIEETDCTYIICLDADDKLHPEYISTLLPALEADRGLGVVWSKLGLTDEGGQPNGHIWDFDFEWEAQASATSFRNGIPAGAMFRRVMWERAGGYRQSYHPAEDAEFWMRGLSIGFKARRVSDQPLFLYRTHPGSASQTKTAPDIHSWYPWSRDSKYPMGAPASTMPLVRSYAHPALTVVIPVGPGHVKYLGTAIESLLGQTYRDWAVIVVNDTDSPQEITNALKPYPFVKLLSTAEPGGRGAGVARNTGVKAAKSPLVMFLDADDYLLPDAMAKMLDLYGKSGGDYIYTDYLEAYATEQKARESRDYDQKLWLERALHPITVLMATDDVKNVKGFDPTLSGYEDWEFFIRLALSGVCGKRLPEPLLVYRMQTGARRTHAFTNQAAILEEFTRRYGAYMRGEKMAGGCCGGGAEAILAAKVAAGDFMPEAAVSTNDNQTVRLQYTGAKLAAVPFGVPGTNRTYYAGNNDFDRVIEVQAADVTHLLGLGHFQRV